MSSAGVPVFVADVKGDLSGVAEPGEAGGVAAKRAAELGLQFQARGFPVEFFALGGLGPGIPIRATVSDFGPQLLAKVLGANETQEQSLAWCSTTPTRRACQLEKQVMRGVFGLLKKKM